VSNFAWIIFLVLILTLLGTLTLVLITVKFYWGDRGTPPPKGEERRRLREEELRLRAKQIELAKRNPIATRKSSFWDNSKVYKDGDSG
jgi:hypothetical protein